MWPVLYHIFWRRHQENCISTMWIHYIFGPWIHCDKYVMGNIQMYNRMETFLEASNLKRTITTETKNENVVRCNESGSVIGRNKRHYKMTTNVSLATCFQGSVVGYIMVQHMRSLQILSMRWHSGLNNLEIKRRFIYFWLGIWYCPGMQAIVVFVAYRWHAQDSSVSSMKAMKILQ